MSLNIKLLLMIGSCFQLKHNYTCLIILLKYLIKIFNKNNNNNIKIFNNNNNNVVFVKRLKFAFIIVKQ